MLEDLLKQTNETTILEFKREIRLFSSEDKKEFARDICAFANTKGGHIVFGKEDAKEGGRIVGIRPETFNHEQMQQIISRRCYPPVKFRPELIQFRSTWFGLLTIHESALKPHEIVGTREVWIRRGATTDKASTREIKQMWEESQRRPEFEEPEVLDETSLAAFEERAINAALISFYILGYLPIRLVTFWALGKGLGLTNWLSLEALAPPFVLIIIIWVLRSLFGTNIMKTMMSFLRRISVPYLMSTLVFLLAISILNLMVFLYPESTRHFFHNAWLDFLVITALSSAVAFIAIVLSFFLITQYFAKSEDLEYMPTPAKQIGQLIHEWKQNISSFQNKLPTIMTLTLLLITIAIVPLDIATGLFIPSYYEGAESYSHAYYGVSDLIHLFIYSERISPTAVRSDCGFFRLAQIQLNVHPAKLPLLSTIRVPNPTNVTSGSMENPGIQATSSVSSRKILGHVSVSTSKGIDYEFIPQGYNFTSIEFEFSGVSDHFVANVSYWKYLENPRIIVTCSEPRYADLGNGTWLEIYTFIIENNEEVSLKIMALEFDRFLFSVIDTTTTKVYSQGQEWITDFVHMDRRLGIWLTIGAGHTLNLTTTFQSVDIT